MARVDTLTNFLTDVADSIRSKTGKSETIACEDFDTEIESISSYEPYRLPSQYQEVEYIGITDGNGYIDTEFIPTYYSKAVVRGLMTSGTFLLGEDTSWANKGFGILARYSYFSNKWSSVSMSLNVLYDFTVSKDGYYWGTSLKDSFSGASTFTAEYSLYVFANHRNGSPDEYGKGRIYSLDLYEDGVLRKQFIPCYEKSTNTIGLYDLVGEKFHSSQGSGTWIKGEDHDVPKENLQTKSVTITENTTTTIEPDEGYDGLESVNVTTNIPASTPTLQTKSVTLTENITTNVTPDTGYDGLSSVSVTANVSAQPTLQSKNITITNNTTTNVSADNGYDGLREVSIVTNIPTSGGIIEPEKGYVITEWNENGYPTKMKINGMTSLPQNVLRPANASSSFLSYLKELILPNSLTYIDQYALTGLVRLTDLIIPNNAIVYEYGLYQVSGIENLIIPANTKIWVYTFYGCGNLKTVSLRDDITEINAYSFNGCGNLELTSLPSSLTTIGGGNLRNGAGSMRGYTFANCQKLALTSLPSTLTSIMGDNNFLNCKLLALTELPNRLTSLGTSTFSGCTSLALTTLPDNLTSIGNSAFYNCTSLVKISMNNVTNIFGSGATNGAFRNCTGLKKLWIGSAITSAGLGRYSFIGCTSLETMYINLPRATVEAFTNYQYTFMNDTSKTGIIICNDDSNFIDKETFDALIIE